ncbi:eukaryotic translation initiation factor 5B-like [Iris pallida]|uniref:Eukaryotic translation initiation factor 5B n=1 Tax=Iris pallida TaxID=29817 RepID=A0AAX6IGU7_IRIPA|nr:eukaryotic translation initiation factor 5B-like [Iris pallida]
MGRKKNVTIDDDEYSLPQEEEDQQETRAAAAAPSKKNKKGGKSNRNAEKFDDVEDELEKPLDGGDDDEPIPMVFSGKKKSSKSKKSAASTAFSAFSALGDDEGNDDAADEFDRSDVGNGADEAAEEMKDLDLDLDLAFGKNQKKKKKKKGGKTPQEEEEDLDKLLAELGEALPPSQPAVMEAPTPVEEEAAKENDLDSKSKKKKKKKSGRTAQEEEDLDKILAELGEVPAPSSSGPIAAPAAPLAAMEEPVAEVEEKEVEGDVAESAAAKKKKKKKEKEKEKRAAASGKEEKKEEAPAPTKVVDNKKLPKHVREMQEALARRKEMEERMKREEEERLRKEEEERLRQEELERLAEEAKRRKKEREKEKILKKKQEGKLLTGKQKEEARRREAMRNQFLAQAGELPIVDGPSEVKKKPKYERKKAKPKLAEAEKPQEVVEAAEPDQAEADSVVDDESVSQVGEAEEKVEGQEVEGAEAMEEDDDEEWDAKSWDDVDVSLPGISPFEEEDKEDEEDAKPVVRKGAPAIAEPVKKPVSPSVATKKGDMDNNGKEHEEVKKEKEAASKKELKADTSKKSSGSDLRSPICCILGHVDTGKTKLLDCIRRTNVQEGEAGGITQQIGATYFPTENIRERTRELKADATLKVPGLLVIDTPGHESFSNLRSRGSSLCDIAVLVVDIMHGLEPQTIESLNLLKSRNTEFIVALNKVDRLYGWKSCPNAPIIKAMKQQTNDVKNEFNMRLTQIITEFKEQGLNTALYYKNKEMGETFNIVPTSAISGEGIPDLLLLLVQWAQKTMEEKLTYVDEVQCTVLEVKVIEGLGTTIDVVLVNGLLHEGDQIVVCGMQGPIMTTIRALLTPHPMKELRVKGTYLHHKELKAAQGVKISAQGLEHAIAGTALYVVGPNADAEHIKATVMQDMDRVMSRIDKSGEGVYVQASTLGSLEALTEFLKSPAVNIPFSDFNIGPVHKKDVVKASVMLDKKKEYATILAFDVKIMPDARELANESGVRIFEADIIYHLFDQFKAYIDNLREEKKKESAEEAVFPCVLKIMPNCVFNKKDPIILGVDVAEGILKVGTPICIPSRDYIDIGRIASMEVNHKQVDTAKKGEKVAIKIVSNSSEEQQKMYGRHFEIDDELVSHITRRSIDILKADYRDDLSTEEWRLVVKLKQIFKIP